MHLTKANRQRAIFTAMFTPSLQPIAKPICGKNHGVPPVGYAVIGYCLLLVRGRDGDSRMAGRQVERAAQSKAGLPNAVCAGLRPVACARGLPAQDARGDPIDSVFH